MTLCPRIWKTWYIVWEESLSRGGVLPCHRIFTVGASFFFLIFQPGSTKKNISLYTLFVCFGDTNLSLVVCMGGHLLNQQYLRREQWWCFKPESVLHMILCCSCCTCSYMKFTLLGKCFLCKGSQDHTSVTHAFSVESSRFPPAKPFSDGWLIVCLDNSFTRIITLAYGLLSSQRRGNNKNIARQLC